MLSALFKSYLIRHLGTGNAFKDTQRVLEQLKHSQGTQRTLWNLESTQVLVGYSSTRALKALRHSDT